MQAIEQIDVVRDSTAHTLASMVDFGRPSGAPNDGYIVIRARRPLGHEATAALRAASYDTQGLHAYVGESSDAQYASVLASAYSTAGRDGEFMAKRSTGGLLRAGATRGGLRAKFAVLSAQRGR